MPTDYAPPAYVPSGPELIPVPPSPLVDRDAVTELVASARAVTACVTDPRIGGSERLARARLAADQARDLSDVVELLDPYLGGTHARLADIVALHPHNRAGGQEEAAERLALDAQHRELAAQVRAIAGNTTADVPGLLPTIGAGSSRPATQAVWLNGPTVRRPRGDLGKGRTVAGWWDPLPEAVIDPAELSELTTLGSVIDGTDRRWHLAAYGLDVSQQLVDWEDPASTGPDETEALIRDVVDVGLEATLLADLARVAVPGTLEAAESAVGGSGWAPDLFVVNPVDLGTARRAYAAAYRGSTASGTPLPPIVATAGQPAGTGLLMASGGVVALATDVMWMAARRPALLGLDVVALRYGLVGLRSPAAVAVVDLTPAP